MTARRKMDDREYAFGWLVFGMGFSIPTAANIASNASTPNIERWAQDQKRALTAFIALLEKLTMPSDSEAREPETEGAAG